MLEISNKFNAAVWHVSVSNVSINRGESIGTGFLFEVKTPSSNKGVRYDYRRVFLVSNRHVLYEYDCGDGLGMRRAKHLRLCRTNTPAYWPLIENTLVGRVHTHSNPDVDLAMIEVTNEINTLKANCPDFEIKPLTSENLLTPSEWRLLGQEKPCAYVGYFSIHETENIPENGDCRFSIDPKVNFENLPQFKVTGKVFPGASGSPVFAVPGSKPKLCGILAESIYRDFLRSQIPHWGVAVKTTALVELLDEILGKGNWK